ncbi:MAG: DUF928 domain-containing protein [Xenococcus sp. MO_188.B8]|nr:DUF928 domain-containing protein [Xenococcus sp. MO_188.B8]
MINIKIKSNKVISICSLAIALNWGLGSLIATAQAQEVTQANSSKITANDGLPFHRRDGGTRAGNCITNGNNLIALIPNKSVNVTASITPKLFFYLPATKQQKTIEFVLRNQNDQLVHEVFLQTTAEEGIMNVEIPQDISKDLEQSDSSYHWYLSMICDDQKRSHDLVLEGWIEHVELQHAVKQKLKNSSPVEQAELYQQEGVWYDALSVLAANSSQVIDHSAISKWSQMLDFIGLSELSEQPFIDSEVIKE